MHFSRATLPQPAPPLPIAANRLFMGATQREVAAALNRELAKPGSIMAVTGEAGLGKTTLVNAVVAELAHRPDPAGDDADGFGAKPLAVQLRQALSLHGTAAKPVSLMGSGRFPVVRGARGILIIDDAHDLPLDTLRMLSDILGNGVAGSWLPRIVLVARPEFWGKLSDPGLARLRDKIGLRAALFPLTYTEAEDYVEHLFRLAGGSMRAVLPADALHALVLRCQGSPRRLNAELEALLANRAERRSLPAGLPAASPVAGTRRYAGPAPPRRLRRWIESILAACAVVMAGVVALVPSIPVPSFLAPYVPLLTPAPPGEQAPNPGGPALTVTPTATPAPTPAPARTLAPPPAPAALAIPVPIPAPPSDLASATPPPRPDAPAPPLERAGPSVAAEPAESSPSGTGQPPPEPLTATETGTAQPSPVQPAPVEWGPVEWPPVESTLTQPAPVQVLEERNSAPPVPEAPPPPASIPSPPPAPLPAPRPARAEMPEQRVLRALPDAVVAMLIRRGNAMLELRDVSAARRLFERAALAGSGKAATALGRTFDPGQRPNTPWEADADPAVAAAWYQLAVSLGDEEAQALLARLGTEGTP